MQHETALHASATIAAAQFAAPQFDVDVVVFCIVTAVCAVVLLGL